MCFPHCFFCEVHVSFRSHVFSLCLSALCQYCFFPVTALEHCKCTLQFTTTSKSDLANRRRVLVCCGRTLVTKRRRGVTSQFFLSVLCRRKCSSRTVILKTTTRLLSLPCVCWWFVGLFSHRRTGYHVRECSVHVMLSLAMRVCMSTQASCTSFTCTGFTLFEPSNLSSTFEGGGFQRHW